MKQNFKVIISGGGTGGHIFPAISIADNLKKVVPEVETLFVGALGKMEMERVPAAGYKIIGLPIVGLKRSLSIQNLLLPLKIINSIIKAYKVVSEFRPNIVVGVGGYASAPLMFAALLKGIPTLIQEQNSFAGLTNRLLGRWATKVCVAYNGMEKFFPRDRLLVTGNPIRESIKPATIDERELSISTFNLDPNKKTLLVTGGSLGARTLNECLKDWILSNQDSRFNIIWQYGKFYSVDIDKFLKQNKREYLYASQFLTDMSLAYDAADLVITRAGAGTVSELSAAAKAAIFVPSPNVTEDHQTHNAMALTQNGAALMVKDIEARSRLMLLAVETLENDELLKSISTKNLSLALPKAAETICNEIIKIVENGSKE